MRLPFAQIDTTRAGAGCRRLFLAHRAVQLHNHPQGNLSDLHEDVLVGGVRRLRGGALARVAFARDLGPRELAIEFVVDHLLGQDLSKVLGGHGPEGVPRVAVAGQRELGVHHRHAKDRRCQAKLASVIALSDPLGLQAQLALAALVVDVHRVERSEVAGGNCWAGHLARDHVAVGVGQFRDVGLPRRGGRRALGRAEEVRLLAVVLGGHGNHADNVNDAAHLQERTAGHAPQLLLELILRVASETVLDVHDRRAPLLC